jgi:hypothetical protein
LAFAPPVFFRPRENLVVDVMEMVLAKVGAASRNFVSFCDENQRPADVSRDIVKGVGKTCGGRNLSDYDLASLDRLRVRFVADEIRATPTNYLIAPAPMCYFLNRQPWNRHGSVWPGHYFSLSETL